MLAFCFFEEFPVESLPDYFESVTSFKASANESTSELCASE